ncbi:MAG: AAA family ATPase, partial [Caldilineaceae bacterium]
MSHPFGDLLSQHLHRKHGLSQAKLAAGILQDPSIIGKMCKGQRLTGPQARERVVAIMAWLQRQGALMTVAEANALLAAAGMAVLRASEPSEAALLQQLAARPAIPPLMIPPLTPLGTNLPTSSLFRGRTEERAKHNLPAQATPFVGRNREMAAVLELLGRPACRLVTIAGAGGMGKTRLSIAVAAAATSRFAHGICFVPLANVETPQAILPTIAAKLDLPDVGTVEPRQLLYSALCTKNLLLVLDNLEHLIDGANDLAALLQQAPQLTILVTSQERLNLV